MAHDQPLPQSASPPPRRRWLRHVLVGAGALLAVLAATYLWLGSDGGRRYAASRINAYRFENGLEIRVSSVEGSLFGKLKLKGLSLRDGKGAFATSPEVLLDWRPLPLLASHLDIRSLEIPRAQWLRIPQLKPGPPDQPLLPDLDIDIDRLELGGLRVMPAVTGREHLLTLSGKAHIADGRAQISARGRSIAGQGRTGGDRLSLLLDAVPEENRLKVDAALASPAGGFVAGMVGAKAPLALSLKGRGDWASWHGRFSGSAGKALFADLAVSGRDGAFAINGPVRVGLLTGNRLGLLDPAVQLALRVTVQDRRLTLGGGVRNDRFRLGVAGVLDLGESAYDGLTLSFNQVKPGPLAVRLGGDGVVARLGLDGAFAAPRMAYSLRAKQMTFASTVMEGLAVSGKARLEKDHWLIPVEGSVRRVSGVNPLLEPLLANLKLQGDFAYANSRLLSDNVKLRSDRIDATAVVVADLDKAVYTGGLQGRIDNYRVESVGIFNLQSTIDLKSGAPGYFKLAGRVTARSTRLLSDGLRDFLGGNALVVADLGYDSNGIASVDRITIAAPAFRLTEGSGRYLPDGAISFAGRGRSTRYGPLALSLSGTASSPVGHVVASRPDMGVGLADVRATVTPSGAGYRIEGRGESDYGPVEAALLASATGDGTRLEVQRGTRFSGVALTGVLEQPRGGPFAGTLLASGSGIDGQLRLSPLAGRQRIEAHLRGDHASLPGRVGFAADRAILDADIVLHDQPQIAADLQVAGMALGRLTISAARGRLNYRGGSGTGQLLAEGRTRYPFRIAANFDAQPRLWRLALKGRVNGIDIASKGPLRIIPEGGEYRLRSSVLAIGDGSLHLVGHYGKGIEIRSRLEGVNLALANPFLAWLGLSGVASGSLDFAQASLESFPSADARLQVKDFTRTSLASTSLPVDIHLVGRLLPNGGTAGAIIRRRGAAVGRMQLALSPLGPEAGPWTTRLLAAPLSGGLRYNGPADALFSLAALPDQDLKGILGVAADFKGRANSPQVTGLVRANNLTYDNGRYGTRLTRMQLLGSFNGDRLLVESLTAKAGDGTVSGQGFVSLSSSEGFPAQLDLDLKRARIASGADLGAVATGQVRVVNSSAQGLVVKGKLTLPETHYRIVRQGSASVATLSGVRRKPSLRPARITGEADNARALPIDWALDVDLDADNKVFVTGMGLNSEWAAKLHAGGTTNAPVYTGGITLVRGTLGFAGRSFELTEGRLRFTGGVSPDMRIVATGDVEGVTTNITITGTSDNPQIAFTSIPSLPRDELMARILFGNSVGQLSAVQAVQLAASLNSLRGGKGGLSPLGVLQSSTGIDRVRILGSDEKTGRETSVALGKYVSNNVYIEIVTDARGYTAAQIEVSLSRALSVLSETGSFGTSSVGLRYRKDY
jgi:translocation and assembly module TamB